MNQFDKHLSVICEQVLVLLCLKTDSWLCFAILFRLFDLTFFLFCNEKRFTRPTLPFVKTVGSEVFRGNFDCASEQNYCSHLGMGFLQSYLSVPRNLRRSNVMTVLKKERRYSYLYQPPSEIRPLAVAGVGCYWRPERGK